MNKATQHTRGQRLAGIALERIHAVAQDAAVRKEYNTRALGFPALLMQSGLAQAVGFLRAKSRGNDQNAYGRYLKDLARVMGAGDGTVLHEKTIHASMPEYRYLTREALDASGWLKRFAQTVLSDDES